MRALYVRVGALVLVGAALLVGAAILFGGTTVQHGHTYETYLRDSVQGLDVGAPVKYRGVAVGVVTQIALTGAVYGRGLPDASRPSTLRTVLVRFQVDADRVGNLPSPASIARGLRARTAPQGLTGTSYIELDFADPDRYQPLDLSWTPQYDYIPGMPSTLSQVQDQAVVLLNKLQQVDVVGLANGAQALVGELRGELEGGDAHAALTEAAATLHALRTALDAADVPGLAAELRTTLAATQTLAQGPQTKALLASTAQAMQRLQQVAAQLPPLLASLDAVARRANAGSADVEASLGPLLQDARTSLDALRETSEALRRDPSQVLLAGPPPRRANR